MKGKFLIIIVLLAFSYTDANFTYNGNFSNFYALRNSNNEVLNIPFRMLELNTTLRLGNNFEIKSFLSSQYYNTNDDYFDYNNINSELRELYMTYYFNSGEISLGKKLFTLGSVDENSPIDHFNPYNYYYLLIGGVDKKVGVEALSFELYFGNNYKLSGAYSPKHNRNYYPQNDSLYSLSLPITPSWYEFLDNKGSEHESLLSLQTTLNNNTEITLTHLRAFDRVFSLSGFTMHKFSVWNESTNDWMTTQEQQNPGKWFSYKLTETLNLGIVQLFNDFTIRTDIAFFHSFDRYNVKDYESFRSVQDYEYSELDPDHNDLYVLPFDLMDIDGDCPDDDTDPECYDDFLAPLHEDVRYMQFTFQLELPLPNDWQFNMQYFQYKLNDYSITDYTFKDVKIETPLFTIDLNDVISDDGEYFTPGFGSSMATLTQKSILFGIEKYMLDNNLKSTFTSFFDLDKGNGKLMSFEMEYEVSNNINLLFGSTKIFGDSSVQSKSDFDLGYTFNLMKDFSHNRIQLSYYF